MTVVKRHTQIAQQVLFVDGLTGTGKTMVSPILSSFRRMEVQRIDHIYEYVCALKYLDRMEEDAAVELVQMYVDLTCYNSMIGRETNFRWKDLSGVLSNPGGWRYVKRLFQPDGNAVMERIDRVRPILQLHCHQVLGIAGTLFQALEDRITMVQMVRHPLYLLEHWYSYIDRFGTDPRDFTIWLHHDGVQLPWYAHGWEDQYVNLSKMDRVIYSIEWLNRSAQKTIDAMDEKQRSKVLVVPFERFVADPWPYLHRLESLLDTTTTTATRRSLRKQKVPRTLTRDGRDLPIYRRYNWSPPSRHDTEAGELKRAWDYAAAEASPEGMAVLEKMGSEYEERYLKQEVAA